MFLSEKIPVADRSRVAAEVVRELGGHALRQADAPGIVGVEEKLRHEIPGVLRRDLVPVSVPCCVRCLVGDCVDQLAEARFGLLFACSHVDIHHSIGIGSQVIWSIFLVAVTVIDHAVENSGDLGPGNAKGAGGMDRVIAVCSAAKSRGDFIEAGFGSPEARQQNTECQTHFKSFFHFKKPTLSDGPRAGGASRRLVLNSQLVHTAAVAEGGKYLGKLFVEVAEVADETPVLRLGRLFDFMFR